MCVSLSSCNSRHCLSAGQQHFLMPDGTLEIGVQQLPLETLEVVLALLDPSALVKLHAATAASIPTIRKRLLAMRCARHWYQLTIRVPSPSAMLPFSTLDLVAASSSSHATTSADDTSEARSDASTLAAPIAQSHSLSTQHTDREDSGFDVQLDQDFEPCDTDAGGLQDSELSECSGSSSDREQSPTVLQPAARNRRQRVQWCPCSKQRLLECLYGQIQHINDVAALMFHMTLCKRFNFNIHRSALGLAEDNHPMTGMMGLETQVQKAFLLGYYCFVDFDTAKQHHATNGKCLKLSIKVMFSITWSLMISWLLYAHCTGCNSYHPMPCLHASTAYYQGAAGPIC